MLFCTIFCCSVLYLLNCTVLYCTELYCTVPYCTVLYCTVLYCTALYCTVLVLCLYCACTVLVLCLYCACTVLVLSLYCPCAVLVLYCTILYCVTVLCCCRILKNLLYRLEIRCDNDQYGCTAVVKLDVLPIHLKECEHNPKVCYKVLRKTTLMKSVLRIFNILAS